MEAEAVSASRLLRHVQKTPGCWYWRGNVSDCGYGRVRVHGRLRAARRVAYETWVGPIPENCLVGVSCHQRACVRPGHLVLVRVVRLSLFQIAEIAHSELSQSRLAMAFGVTPRHVRRLRRVSSLVS